MDAPNMDAWVEPESSEEEGGHIFPLHNGSGSSDGASAMISLIVVALVTAR